jgi:hypothetical protein
LWWGRKNIMVVEASGRGYSPHGGKKPRDRKPPGIRYNNLQRHPPPWPPARARLLKFPPLPNIATSWAPSVQQISLWQTSHHVPILIKPKQTVVTKLS